MASPRDLPEMIGEFVALARQYLREQTLDPAKRLGRLAGFSLAASILFVLAALFLAVAGMRTLVEAMPAGTIWSGVGYMAAAVGVLAVAGLVMWRVIR